MRTTGLQLLAVSLLVAPALADILIGAPYSVPSRVASDGSIVSDFGTFSIVLSGERARLNRVARMDRRRWSRPRAGQGRCSWLPRHTEPPSGHQVSM